MSPGLIGSGLVAVTPPQYHNNKMEDSLFPPISRKSAISVGSEQDPNDFCNSTFPMDRKLTTRGSVPASLSSSPIKFPSIDRANSTSIASLPGSRATRHRSQSRDIRASYCRSPSCPSNLDSRKFSNLDLSQLRKDSQPELTIKRSDSSNLEETMKLPNIFHRNSECKSDSAKQPNTMRAQDKSCDRMATLALRRSESIVNALESIHDNSPTTSGRDPQRNQTAALLLPIRGEIVGNRKAKKKRRQRLQAEEEDSGNTARQNGDDDRQISVRRRSNSENEDTLDAINAMARENTYKDGGAQLGSPRAIEVNSSRSVKQWMGGNRNAQKEGKIKV